MATYTTGVEIASSLPAAKLFKVFNDFDNIGPKVAPQTYKSVSLIKGDGGVGSIKNITYGDGLPFTNSKYTIDAIDTSNLILENTVFEGDTLLGIIETATYQMKFIPYVDGGSIFKHTVVFKCKGDAKLTEDVTNHTKEAFKNTFKAVESYVIAHPETY